VPIDSFQENLTITRQATLILNQGAIDVLEMGEIVDAGSTTETATGQIRQTGRKAATDVACMVNMSDPVVVAQVNAAKAAGLNGLEGYVTQVGSIIYYDGRGEPSGILTPDEMQIHTVTYPGTAVGDDGQEARMGFTLSVWGAGELIPI